MKGSYSANLVTIQYRLLGLPISFKQENRPKQHKVIYYASSQSTYPPFSFLVFLSFSLLFRSFLLSSVPTTQTQIQTPASRLFPPFSFFFAFVGPYYSDSDSDPGFSSISSFFILFCFRRSLLLRPWLLVYFMTLTAKVRNVNLFFLFARFLIQ